MVKNFRWVFVLALSLFLENELLAQENRDSLLLILKTSKSEKDLFNTYKKLGELYQKESPAKAILYFTKATSLPLHLEYAKDFVDVYQSLGHALENVGKYDSSLLAFQQSLSLAQKFKLVKEEASSKLGKGLTFLRMSVYDSAKSYFDQALLISIQLKDLSLQAGTYNNLGNLLVEESNQQGALDFYIKAAKIYEQINEESGLIRAYSNIGNIQNMTGQTEKAIEYAQLALNTAEKKKDYNSIGYCHQLLGRVYRKRKDYEKSMAEYQLAVAAYASGGNQMLVAQTEQGIGNIFGEQKRYKEALAQYEKSLAIGKRIDNPSLLAYSHSSLGWAWWELKNYSKASAFLDSSIVYARRIQNPYLVMDALEIRSNMAAELGNYKKALEIHQQFASLKDSIAASENQTATKELEAKYQSTKKQAEIDLLHKDQLLQGAELRQNRIIVLAMVILLVLVMALGFLVFNRNKIVNQSKRQTELENMRNTIARDLHDDIGSALSSINIMSQLAQSKKEDSGNYLQRIGERSAKVMENMSDIVWSINTQNDSGEMLVSKLKEFASEILEPKQIKYSFVGDELLTGLKLGLDQRKNIFLILKEAINNAAKYSSASEVLVQFEKTADKILFKVFDNGHGFDTSNAKLGNGLKNMNDRALQIKSAVSVSSSIGNGTTITLAFPLHD